MFQRSALVTAFSGYTQGELKRYLKVAYKSMPPRGEVSRYNSWYSMAVSSMSSLDRLCDYAIGYAADLIPNVKLVIVRRYTRTPTLVIEAAAALGRVLETVGYRTDIKALVERTSADLVVTDMPVGATSLAGLSVPIVHVGRT
jgi:hypothetical protein